MENIFQLFYVLFIWILGHFFAIIVVAKYIYLPWKKRLELEDVEIVPKYEDKYLINEIDDSFIEPNNVSNDVYVTETTPEGYVIMRYNNEEEGFEYWADNSNIKYVYLEVVSRKYVYTLLCKNLYKNRKEETDGEKDEQEGEKEETDGESDDEKEKTEDDVFVKPKISKKETNEIKETNRKTSNIEGNKYIRKGKICDLKIFKLKKNTKKETKKISFFDYKMLMKKKD